MRDRIKLLTDKILEKNLDAIFLGKTANVQYMSGFTGTESFILFTPAKKYFITDSRYTEQAEKECTGYQVVRWGKNSSPLTDTLDEVVREAGLERIGFEKDHVTYEMYQKLNDNVDGVHWIPVKGMVEDLRYIKDENEIEKIRRAAGYADRAFTGILEIIRPGLSEKELALELEYLLRKAGADDAGFKTILVSGVNTSLPHGIPSDKKVEAGDFITMDFGGLCSGYRSDMTRTIVVGKADDKQKEYYQILKEAQEMGLKYIKAGTKAAEADTYAREQLQKYEVADKFGHGLGHGVGLEIHEEPYMKKSSKKVLEAGCVVTVEPGIYFPGWGGIRIEDTVVIREDGIEILTGSDKELIELN
ncbi:MAG: M24 family metallopeptidase [Halanaerobiales bacterium]